MAKQYTLSTVQNACAVSIYIPVAEQYECSALSVTLFVANKLTRDGKLTAQNIIKKQTITVMGSGFYTLQLAGIKLPVKSPQEDAIFIGFYADSACFRNIYLDKKRTDQE